MDPLKEAYLSGRELPVAALVKTLLVGNGEQGVPAKLKEKDESPSSLTCITPAAPCTNICPLHPTLGWDEERPILVPLMRAAVDGNIVSTCYTLQGKCWPFTIKCIELWHGVSSLHLRIHLLSNVHTHLHMHLHLHLHMHLHMHLRMPTHTRDTGDTGQSPG